MLRNVVCDSCDVAYKKIFDFNNSFLGVHNAKIEYRVNFYSNVVFGDDVLRRNIHNDGA